MHTQNNNGKVTSPCLTSIAIAKTSQVYIDNGTLYDSQLTMTWTGVVHTANNRDAKLGQISGRGCKGSQD